MDFLQNIPRHVRLAFGSLFLFTFGWGLGAEAFFSLYLESISQDLFLVGTLTALATGIKLLGNIPVGEIDGKVDERTTLRLGKILYIAVGICYFLAGYLHSLPILIIALVLNGIANPLIFTTYRSYIRQQIPPEQAQRIQALHLTTLSLALGGGSLIAIGLAFLIKDIHWFYLSISAFALISLWTDAGLTEKHHRPFAKEIWNTLRQNPYKKVWKNIRKSDPQLRLMFMIQFFWSILDMVVYIYLPILAFENAHNLPLIAMIYALSRLPYALSYNLAEMNENKPKIPLISGCFMLIALLLVVLAITSSTINIIILAVAITLCLAMIQPIVSGSITQLITPAKRSEMTGAEEFMLQAGGVVGSLLFGWIASLIGIPYAFVILAALVAILSMVIFVMKDVEKKATFIEMVTSGFGIVQLFKKPVHRDGVKSTEQKM